jgi:pyridoxal 5'-phosphate synthase pdxS subunit
LDEKTGKPRNPEEREEAESRAQAIVTATAHYNDPKVLADVSEQMTGAMQGLAVAGLAEGELLQTRGW